jgi:hypothetical protein
VDVWAISSRKQVGTLATASCYPAATRLRWLPSKNRVFTDSDVIYLSRIFDWFEEDFAAASGSVVAFLLPFLPPEKIAAARRGKLRVKFLTYDWKLNETKQ